MVSGGDASPIAVLAVTVVFTVLATLCAILRLFTRLAIAHNAGWDDAFIAAATVFSIGSAGLTILESAYDQRRRHAGIDASQQLTYVKSVYASIILYNAALFCIKISRGFRIACFTLMAAVIVYSNWCVWSAIFFCTPVSAFWDFTIIAARCFDKQSVWFANAAINIISDIATVILPLPMINRLNMQRKSKAALMGVFTLGFLACLMSILRLESLYAAAHLQDGLNYHGAMAALWSAVEINTGIMCSCLPTLRTLLIRVVPHALSSSHRTVPSGQDPRTRSNAHKGAMISLHDHGRGLSGRDEPTQSAYARRHSSIDLDVLGSSTKEIRVVTVVDQEFGKHGDEGDRSEEGSMRDLIHRTSSSV
ncbi:hypothetical protein LTS14_007025 [Recurvomyces mirabilis]|uniref:uncharacterized protein n=1 Tax=Recurvomyces mirabilis TaxID=574656 RepID=UPI002DE15FAA|nr:hypothetical protein LTS14_007025 [Recurvomyces mirabilis]